MAEEASSKKSMSLKDSEGLLNTLKALKKEKEEKEKEKNSEINELSFKWNTKEKLKQTPFRKEMERLKEDNKKNPQNKLSNNQFKRLLKEKEKALLADFQKKGNRAKLWINDAQKEYYNEENETDKDYKEIMFEVKKNKKEAIDQLWEELIYSETIYLQNTTIQLQNERMANLKRQLFEAQNQLNTLNKAKEKNMGHQDDDNKDKVDNIELNENKNKIPKETKKKKKKKSKKDKEGYQGLVGYFNKSQKKNKKKDKQNKKNEKKDVTIDDDKISNKANDSKSNQTLPKQHKYGNLRGGFLNNQNKGLYSDKKGLDELSIEEKNARNLKELQDYNPQLAEAVKTPQFVWTRPKDDDTDKNDSKNTDKNDLNE